jgi:beta-RFAP synthase
MGFFDLHGGLGRKFGSIGLSLEQPILEIKAKHSNELIVIGADSIPQSLVARAYSISESLLDKLNLNGSVELDLLQSMPVHSGLGSGTQLALAIGTVINRLYSLGVSTSRIAELTGRGGRSGIGIAAFDHGGVLIDGGRVLSSCYAGVPPLLARYEFPEQWRILLVFDSNQPGVHGKQEKIAFERLPLFPENLAAHLCRCVLMQAMPALVEQDLNAFGSCIQALQMHVGDYFSPVQGGRYASKLVGDVLQRLGNLGVACYGQSSWGPTGFAVFENLTIAEKHLQDLQSEFSDPRLTWLICSARNTGSDLM